MVSGGAHQVGAAHWRPSTDQDQVVFAVTIDGDDICTCFTHIRAGELVYRGLIEGERVAVKPTQINGIQARECAGDGREIGSGIAHRQHVSTRTTTDAGIVDVEHQNVVTGTCNQHVAACAAIECVCSAGGSEGVA